MAVTFEVKGLRELGEKMRTLGEKKALGAARSATSAAATVIKKRAKAKILGNPSVQSRSLLESVIVKKVPKGETDLTSEHMVTVRGRGRMVKRKGKKVKQSEAPYANIVEFGSIKMDAEPFLGPALEGGQQEAIEAMVERLRKRLFT